MSDSPVVVLTEPEPFVQVITPSLARVASPEAARVFNPVTLYFDTFQLNDPPLTVSVTDALAGAAAAMTVRPPAARAAVRTVATTRVNDDGLVLVATGVDTVVL